METTRMLSRQWIIVGATCGILSFLLFPLLLLVDLPGYLEIAFAILYGILFSLSGFSIHHAMKYKKPTIATQIAALFIFVSGFLFNLMLSVQLTFRGYLAHFNKQVTTQTEIDLLQWIMKTVDPIHLAMQVSNDFFTGIAMLLLAYVMYAHPFFGIIWSISGALIAVVLIGVKCWAFPMTPYELGFPFILGPLLAVWFLAVNIQCLRTLKQTSLASSV